MVELSENSEFGNLRLKPRRQKIKREGGFSAL
jgi:hypothetical protein